MQDGRQWTTSNLNANIEQSYCYGNAEPNCRRYGRLYTWESAQRGCRSLGDGWRVPTDDEWRQVAKQYGGVREDSDDSGKAAYAALLIGGSSGFNALLVLIAVPMIASTCAWKRTDSTGRHQRVNRPVHGSTTLARARFLSIVTAMATSRWRFLCGVSTIDETLCEPVAPGDLPALRSGSLVRITTRCGAKVIAAA
ncbi:MAG: FISUMP domain-containing protein [Thermoanaerobaculia bacterium]